MNDVNLPSSLQVLGLFRICLSHGEYFPYLGVGNSQEEGTSGV